MKLAFNLIATLKVAILVFSIVLWTQLSYVPFKIAISIILYWLWCVMTQYAEDRADPNRPRLVSYLVSVPRDNS